MSISPFEVLNIEPGCSKEELKAVYKDLILKTHPDKHNGNADMFNLIKESYNIIVKYHLPGSTELDLSEIDPKEERVDNINDIDYSKSAEMFIGSSGKLDNDKFNEVFNRLYHRDEGYSNESFDDNDSVNDTLVMYENPEGIGSMGSYLNYEQGNDYSSAPGSNIDFTDYKKAYTDNTKQTELLEKYMAGKLPLNTVSELEKIRSASMQPSAQEIANNIKARRDLQEIEARRVQRVLAEDALAKKQYNILTQMIEQ